MRKSTSTRAPRASLLVTALLASTTLLSACTSSSNDAQPTRTPSASASTQLSPPPPVSTPKPKNKEVQTNLAVAKTALTAAAKQGKLPKNVNDLGDYGFSEKAGTFVTGYEVKRVKGKQVFCITAGSPGGGLYTVTTNTDVESNGLCPADATTW